MSTTRSVAAGSQPIVVEQRTARALPTDGVPQIAGPLVQVRLFTAHSVISGTLRLAFNRLSDHLNFGPSLLTLGQAELARHDSATIHRAQRAAYVQRDAVLLAMDRPNEEYSASHPALRQEKDCYQVSADLGHFVVTGLLHLRRGIDIVNWLGDAPQFVPLTDVTIQGELQCAIAERLALVNRQCLTAILQ